MDASEAMKVLGIDQAGLDEVDAGLERMGLILREEDLVQCATWWAARIRQGAHKPVRPIGALISWVRHGSTRTKTDQTGLVQTSGSGPDQKPTTRAEQAEAEDAYRRAMTHVLQVWRDNARKLLDQTRPQWTDQDRHSWPPGGLHYWRAQRQALRDLAATSQGLEARAALDLLRREEAAEQRERDRAQGQTKAQGTPTEALSKA